METVRLYFLFFFLTLFTHLAVASTLPEPLAVAGHSYQTPQQFPVKLFVDHSKQLTVSEVSQLTNKYHDASSRFVIPANERANYWFVFSIFNQSDREITRAIGFDEPFLYQANFYYQQDNGEWVEDKSGLVVPVMERTIEHRHPRFRVHLQAGETKTVYLMMNSEQNLLTVGIDVKSQHQFLLGEKFETAAYWLFFGISIAMLIYNLFLLFTLKDKLYLYYCLYCLTFLVFAVMYSGFDLYLITSPHWHYKLVVSIVISVVFIAHFMRVLLDTPNRAPKIDFCLTLLMLVYLIQAALTIYDIHYYYLVMYMGIPSMLLLLAVSLYSYIIKIPLANYALFGLSWHLLGLLLVVAVNAGFMEYNALARYGFMVGSVIELFCFSLALAYRIQHKQANQIATQSERYLIEYRAKQKLETTVQERTQELLELNKKLQLLSQEDGLTGLFNRRYFDEVVTKEWKRMQRQQTDLCLIVGDIDFFKQFNDIYGHQQGDQCLRIISEVLKSSANRSSDTVARYGGEEFVIVLPDSSVEDGWQVAYKIKKALKDKHINHQYSDTGLVTMSFGISALTPNQENNFELLFRQADNALYQSKENGRNRITIFQE